MIEPCGGRVSRTGRCPSICAGIISATGIENAAAVPSAPDDHFATGPDCRVKEASRRRVSRARRGPTIVGIVSPATVQVTFVTIPAPHDHFAAGPHCAVAVSGAGCIGDARGRPTICNGAVFPARVDEAHEMKPAPDNHLTAGPDGRVPLPVHRRVSGAGRCPSVIGEWSGFTNLRNTVGQVS